MKVICIADLAFDPCFTNSSVWGGFSLTCLYWLIIIFLFFHLLHWHCFVQKAKRMQITLCSLFTHFITGLFFFPYLPWIFVWFTILKILLLDIVLFAYNNKKKQSDLGSITGEFQHLQYVYVTCRMVVLLAWNL